MGRIFSGATAALALVALAGGAGAQVLGTPVDEGLDGVFEEFGSGTPGCGVALLDAAGTLHFRGYGEAVLEHGVPITPTTVFHAASIAKPMTAMAVAQLVGEGRLSLDDEVRKHIPELPPYGHPLTVRHLLTHTSGVRDQWVLTRLAGWRDGDPISQGDILALLFAQRELGFEPGSAWVYSNSNYTLLAEIVERVSGRPFPEYTRERIFEPLGMDRTRFQADHRDLIEGRASAYEPEGDGWKVSEPVFDNYGATNLLTTPMDLARWARNLWTREVSPEAVDLLVSERARLSDGTLMADIGLGLFLGRPGGLLAAGHNGSDAGFTGDLLAFLDERLAVATLCNVATAYAYDLNPAAARVALSDRWAPPAPREPRAPREEEPAPAPLTAPDRRRLAGAYRSAELDVTWLLVVDGDALVLHRRRFAPVTLRTSSSGALTWASGSYEIGLVPEGDRIVALRVTHERARNIRFDRVEERP